jgi:hypothetical protein
MSEEKDLDNYCSFATRHDQEAHLFLDQSHHASLMDALQGSLPLKHRSIFFDEYPNEHRACVIAPCPEGHIHIFTNPAVVTIDMLNMLTAFTHALALCLDGGVTMGKSFRIYHLEKRVDDVCNVLAPEYPMIEKMLRTRWTEMLENMYEDRFVKVIQQLVPPPPGKRHFDVFDPRTPLSPEAQHAIEQQGLLRACFGYTLKDGAGEFHAKGDN